MLAIVPYDPSYQVGIDRMMEIIQREFHEPISSPQSAKIYEAYLLSGQKYWVGLDGTKVVGTVGVILLSGNNAVLKRMMAHPAYRGGETGLGRRLLETCISWARENDVSRIYLGTNGTVQGCPTVLYPGRLYRGCHECPACGYAN